MAYRIEFVFGEEDYMNIVVNGKPKVVDENITVQKLLDMEGYKNWVGVWINSKQVLQQEYSNYILNEDDEIKILRPLGGG